MRHAAAPSSVAGFTVNDSLLRGGHAPVCGMLPHPVPSGFTVNDSLLRGGHAPVCGMLPHPISGGMRRYVVRTRTFCKYKLFNLHHTFLLGAGFYFVL